MGKSNRTASQIITDRYRQKNLLDEIAQERDRQDGKWGIQNHDRSLWMEILGEEYGETCKASLEHRFGKGSIKDYRTELIHTAAVAVAAIECLDRHKAPDGQIYLAGPIANCNDEACFTWRDRVQEEVSYTCLDPAAARDFRVKTTKDPMNDIINPDKADIDASAILLAFCWKTSVGTSQEILYAWERGKLVISVIPEELPVSPWISAHSHVLYRTLAEAINYINSLADQEPE